MSNLINRENELMSKISDLEIRLNKQSSNELENSQSSSINDFKSEIVFDQITQKKEANEVSPYQSSHSLLH